MPSIINASSSGSGGIVQTADASGVLQLQSNGTTALTVSGANVGIGTSSPGAKLDVVGNMKLSGELLVGTSGSVYAPLVSAAYIAGTSNLFLRNISGVNRIDSYNDPITATYPLQINASQQTFLIADSEKMRIDSSGNLLVGTTSALGKYTLRWDSATQQGFAMQAAAATFAGSPIIFYNSTGGVSGFIGQTTSTISFNASSDYRLKNTITPMTGALAKVALLKPCTYKWNIDGSDGQGFIAHELAEVEPGCVTGEKDAVDAEGKPKYQGIDTSFLVATLTAAIQELKAIIDTQATRITALEAK